MEAAERHEFFMEEAMAEVRPVQLLTGVRRGVAMLPSPVMLRIIRSPLPCAGAQSTG